MADSDDQTPHIAMSISDTLPIIETCEREIYDDEAIAEGSFYDIDGSSRIS